MVPEIERRSSGSKVLLDGVTDRLCLSWGGLLMCGGCVICRHREVHVDLVEMYGKVLRNFVAIGQPDGSNVARCYGLRGTKT